MDARKSRMPVGTIVKITDQGKLGRIHADPSRVNPNEPQVIFPDNSILYINYDAMEAVNISVEVKSLEKKIKDNEATLELLGNVPTIQLDIVNLMTDLDFLKQNLETQTQSHAAQQEVNPIKKINIVLLEGKTIVYNYDTRGIVTIEDIYLWIRSKTQRLNKDDYKNDKYYLQLPGDRTVHNLNDEPIYLKNIGGLNDGSTINLIVGDPRKDVLATMGGNIKYKKRRNTKKRRKSKNVY